MRGVKSDLPWQEGPDWGKAEGVVAVLDIDGHHFEVKKRPYRYPEHYVKAAGYNRPPNTSRYQLVVDGQERGSESPKLYSVIAAADAMVNWARLSEEMQPSSLH